MIVFRIYCNFFIVLPIRLKTCRSDGFFRFLQGKICAPEKSGAALQRFWVPERARSASDAQFVQAYDMAYIR